MHTTLFAVDIEEIGAPAKRSSHSSAKKVDCDKANMSSVKVMTEV